MEYNFKHLENSLGKIYCSIRYHERLRSITVTWKATAKLSDLEKAKDEVAIMIRRKKALFLINDFQGLYSNASEAFVKFLEKGWDNEVHAEGLRYIIHIWKEGTKKPPLSDKGAEFIRFCPSKLDAVEWIEKQLNALPPD
ncbi:hypothetical protein [Adhaeribacter soli]|uniref:STAS/SEC14 domain-containing protein n=1 Tax=Adhaeribacter soli TaxID=2607655 RepID=A0A5N1IYN9_9BACT|nr:hypothetical protein [Adhaeribacter soli]KAA9333609.1 hypothetical protein F0P94_10170 [Adhaeribacter soli]